MSSREIAELTGKEHKNVIRDIEGMIGALEKDGSNLIHQANSMGYVRHKDARGYTSSIDLTQDLTYNLVLGYDAARRLKVVRRWMDLEHGAAQPNATTLSREQEIAITALRADIQRASLQMNRLVDTTVLEIMGVTKSDRKRRPRTELTGIQHANGMFRSLLSFNKATGLDRNQAILAANAAVKRETGIDLMAISGTTHLTAIETDQLLTPTAIGQRCNGLGAQAINRALRAMGYQAKEKVGRDEVWLPTKAGEPYAVMQDTGKAHTDGTPVRQLKWRANVVARVEEWLASAPGGDVPFARTPEPVS
ncbi:hypothetical protein AA103193_2400 [Tanticharoenia sakaeratensis NBRC 103193]|nr:hypothetical protein AA103193_2400 [Tanticharoenia sakaeratensis NBRC 103193]